MSWASPTDFSISRWTMSRGWTTRAFAVRVRSPLADRPRGRSCLPGVVGVDYAHAKGFVHLDVKPSNMMVAQEGGKDVVKLSDFGLARIYLTSRMSGLSTIGEFGGTAPFMAPEQINDLRATKPPADQYGEAATLYNFLTDCFIYDFPKKLHAKIMKILLEDPVPIRDRRPGIPEELAAVIHRRWLAIRWPGTRTCGRCAGLYSPSPSDQGADETRTTRNPMWLYRAPCLNRNRLADRQTRKSRSELPPRIPGAAPKSPRGSSAGEYP